MRRADRTGAQRSPNDRRLGRADGHAEAPPDAFERLDGQPGGPGVELDRIAGAVCAQEHCAQFADDAAVIAFLLGDSESLLWEFRRTIETRSRATIE